MVVLLLESINLRFFICYNILGLYTNSSCLLRFFLFIMTQLFCVKKRAPWENDPLRLPKLRLCNDPLFILQRRKPEPSLPSCSADTLGKRLHPLSFNAISLAFEASYALLLSRKEGVYSFDLLLPNRWKILLFLILFLCLFSFLQKKFSRVYNFDFRIFLI